jgi:hypothetical protein
MRLWTNVAFARVALVLVLVGSYTQAGDVPDGQRWWSHVAVLADDNLEGRNSGSAGHRKAAEYVAAQFARAGLKPGGTSGYLQPVHLISRELDEDHSSLTLVKSTGPEPLVLGRDAIISLRIDPAPAVEAELVFVGHGLSIPEANYDDFAGLDVSGKLVVFLAGAPSMILADPAMDECRGLKLAVTVNPDHADKWLSGSGHTFHEILDAADSGKPLPRFALPSRLKATASVNRAEVESQNVVAVLPGNDPRLKDEFVVFSAHLDHLGIGKPIKGDSIYNGAMDNASGIAAMLDVAAMLKEQGTRLRRSVLFVAVTAEEKGLLGSRYFANSPTVDSKAIVADINTDMFLPLFPLKKLTIYGLDESEIGADAAAVASSLGVAPQADLEPKRNIFIRSDQYSFIRRGIPSLALKVGFDKGSPEEALAKKWLTERYHAPSDDLAQPVDKLAAGAFDVLVAKLLERVANRDERPRWKDTSFFKRFAQ